jgi:predicted small integral membrane protein
MTLAVRDRPAFIPPEIPAPLMDLTSAQGIRRAVPILAAGVTQGMLDYSEAFDLLVGNWTRHCWRSGSMKALNKAARGIEAALLKAVECCDAQFSG